MRTGAIFTLGLLIVIGAATTISISDKETETKTEKVSYLETRSLSEGMYSDVARRVNYLINNEIELRDLWAMTDTEIDVPNVDFKTKQVIALFAGEQPTAGYSINISKVEEVNDMRVVHITLNKPGVSCLLSQVITSPYAIFEIDRNDRVKFTHQDDVNTLSCLDS